MFQFFTCKHNELYELSNVQTMIYTQGLRQCRRAQGKMHQPQKITFMSNVPNLILSHSLIILLKDTCNLKHGLLKNCNIFNLRNDYMIVNIPRSLIYYFALLSLVHVMMLMLWIYFLALSVILVKRRNLQEQVACEKKGFGHKNTLLNGQAQQLSFRCFWLRGYLSSIDAIIFQRTQV